MASYEETVCHKGNCAALPVAFVASSFFIRGHRQKLLVPRTATFTRMPRSRPLENTPS